MFRWLKLILDIANIDYRIRRLERKIYWKEKYGSKEKRIKN